MIKIDMEMPASCIDCKLFRVYYENNEQEWCCGVVFKIINKIDEKPIWCPFIECENEKTCKLTLWDEDSNTYECSECEMKWSLFEGSPNDNGMKFCPECGSKINEIL